MKKLQKILAAALSIVMCAALMLPASAAAATANQNHDTEELIYFLPEKPISEEPIYFLPEPAPDFPSPMPDVTTPHFVSYDELWRFSCRFLGPSFLKGWIPHLENYNNNRPYSIPQSVDAVRAALQFFVPKDELEKLTPNQLCETAKQVVSSEAYQRLHANMKLLQTTSGQETIKETFSPEMITRLHDEIYYAARMLWPNGCPELDW